MRLLLGSPGSGDQVMGLVPNESGDIHSWLSAEMTPRSYFTLKRCVIGPCYQLESWLPYIGAVITTITAWLNFNNPNSNDHVTPTAYYELLYQNLSHTFQPKLSVCRPLLMLVPFAFNLRLILHELTHIKEIKPFLDDLSVSKQRIMWILNICFSLVRFLMVFSGLAGSSSNIYPLPNKQQDMIIVGAAFIFSLPVLPMSYTMSLFNNMILRDGIFAAKCFLNDSCDSDRLLNSNDTELTVKPRHKVLFVSALILAVLLTFPSELLLAADIDNKYVRWIFCAIMVIPESLFHLSHVFVLTNKTNFLFPKELKKRSQVILSALGHALPSIASFLYYQKKNDGLFMTLTGIATALEFLLSLPEAVIHNDHDHKHDCAHRFDMSRLLRRRPKQEDSDPELIVDPLVCSPCV